jgi:3-hydroxy-9,10-secoandrosta-1,3,5(10)-triene-9,17-dione monooxygenase reductase component
MTMVDSPRSEPSPLSLALGRVPSGLFILTVRYGGRATGMLVSWVQQAGFEPPMLTVAVNRDRFVREWIVAEGAFVLNQLPAGNKRLLRHFARGFAADANPFDGLALYADLASAPVLDEALSYLDCEVVGSMESGDHTIFLARILSGALLNPDAEPMVHIRNTGSHY